VQTYQSIASHQLSLALAREPVIVDGDLVRLEQVLSNLVTNAIKYTAPGGHVRVSVHRDDDHGVISVRDNGSGIDAELLPNVFELFTQATPTLDRSRGGLGLGLSLVKSLVERHGGQVHAHSDGLGHGSEFVVRLPLSNGDLSLRGESDTLPAAGDGVWVLVVEDNEDARDTMQLLLEMWGYAVETACDGQEGLDKALARQPAVAIVDIGLPKLDGYEVARQIRARTDGPPRLIAVTGYGQPEDRRQALAAGFDHHLPKPVNAEELALLLRDYATLPSANV
jgi:CheY-like chemotaxis protein/anti-sigma regulatory factor (Ser/Thr protein kinase)